MFDHRIDFWMTWRSPQCHFDLYMTSKSVKVKGAKPPSRPNAQANGLFTPLLFIYFSVWNAWLASVRNWKNCWETTSFSNFPYPPFPAIFLICFLKKVTISPLWLRTQRGKICFGLNLLGVKYRHFCASLGRTRRRLRVKRDWPSRFWMKMGTSGFEVYFGFKLLSLLLGR